MVAANINVTSTLSSRAGIGRPKWQAGMMYSYKKKYTIAEAVETGDTFTFTDMLPTTAVTILGGRFWGKEFDTDASPTATVIIGDGTDTDGYLASKVSAAGPSGAFLAEFDGALLGTASAASDDIVVTLGGTVATAADSGDIWLEVDYLCENP